MKMAELTVWEPIRFQLIARDLYAVHLSDWEQDLGRSKSMPLTLRSMVPNGMVTGTRKEGAGPIVMCRATRDALPRCRCLMNVQGYGCRPRVINMFPHTSHFDHRLSKRYSDRRFDKSRPPGRRLVDQRGSETFSLSL